MLNTLVEGVRANLVKFVTNILYNACQMSMFFIHQNVSVSVRVINDRKDQHVPRSVSINTRIFKKDSFSLDRLAGRMNECSC